MALFAPAPSTIEQRFEGYVRTMLAFPVFDLATWYQGMFDSLGDRLIAEAQVRYGNQGWQVGNANDGTAAERLVQRNLTRDKGIQKRRAIQYAQLIRSLRPETTADMLDGIPRRLVLLEMLLNEEKG